MFRYSLIALLLVALSLGCAIASAKTFTEDEIGAMIAAAPGPERYPQAAGYIILNQRASEFNADGSGTTDWHYVVKILAERGKEKFGDVKHRYNALTDSVVVLKAVTHKADGSVMAVEAKAIHDLTPADLSNAAIYSNIRHKVINFPALQPGVTIELQLRTYHKAAVSDDERFFGGADNYQFTDPVAYKEVSLTLPSQFPIRHVFQNEGVDYTSSASGDKTTYVWSNENSTQIIEEPGMPNLTRIAPRVVYSSVDSWDEIGSWVGEQFYRHVKTDGDISRKSAELTKGAKSTDEKIEKIGLYVISEIRNVAENSLPLGLAGYEPNDADVVLANKYGDWRDKAVLLISLLRAAGIECFPHFVNRNDAILAADMPTLKQFDAVFVYVPQYRNAPLWINPFGDSEAFGHLADAQGSIGLLVKDKSSELLLVSDTPPEANLADCKFEMLIKSNGDVEGSAGCMLTGLFDNMARLSLKKATPKEREQYFQMAANAMGEGSSSREFSVSDLNDLLKPVEVGQKYLTPEMGIVQGEMMIFRVPDLPFGFAQVPASPAMQMRNYDMMIQDNLVLKKQGVVHLPAGFKAVYVADPLKIDNGFGQWQTALTLNGDSTEVFYSASVRLTDKEIDTDEYSEFKKTFDDFSAPRNFLILLEKKQ